MTRIRALAFNILFFPWSVLVMLAALPFVASTGMLWRLRRIWLGGILWLLRVVVGLRVEIRGRAHLPPAPYILAAKHQSMLETFVLGNLLDRPAFVLKRELTLIPVLGWYLKRVGMVPIDRARGPSALRRMQTAARACAAEARPLVIFPEGTRRAPGAAPDYKRGLTLVARATPSLPVVPVALDTGLFWGAGLLDRRPGVTVIEILPPLAQGLQGDALLAAVQAAIEPAAARLATEAPSRRA